jgi:hypothetical protein
LLQDIGLPSKLFKCRVRNFLKRATMVPNKNTVVCVQGAVALFNVRMEEVP